MRSFCVVQAGEPVLRLDGASDRTALLDEEADMEELVQEQVELLRRGASCVSLVRPRRRNVLLGATIATAVVLAVCSSARGIWASARGPALEEMRALVGATLVSARHSSGAQGEPHHTYKCGPMEEDIDYVYASLAGAGHVDNIASAGQCCALCSVEPDCRAYTWVKNARLWFGNPGQCWLKGGKMIAQARKAGVISALVRGPTANETLNALSTVRSEAPHSDDEYGHAAQAMEAMRLRSAEPAPAEVHNVTMSEVEDEWQMRAEELETELASQQAEEDLMTSLAEGVARDMEKEKELAEEVSASANKSLAVQQLQDGFGGMDDPPLDGFTDDEMAADEDESEEDEEPQEETLQPTEAPEEPEPATKCVGQNEGCLESQCCSDPGYQCYTKNAFWAQCMPTCFKGPYPLDQVSPLPWECEELGERAPGEAQRCSKAEENCIASKCCTRAGMTCFTKNATFAQCKPSCFPGPDLRADDNQTWSCDQLGPRTIGSAPWVPDACSKAGVDCSATACCAQPGQQCYRQSPWYAECKLTCELGQENHPGGPWSCDKVGWRTPDLPDDAEEEKGVIGQWVEKTCAKNGDNCIQSQCCHAVGGQCFRKNEYWGACKLGCSSAPDPKDHNETWNCQPLGPKGWGLATKGYPSLYCITLYMPGGYEGELLRHHVSVNGGIFLCDGFDLFAAEDDELGITKDGIVVKPQLIPKIRVGKSQDGTAGNSKLFMAVWDKVIALGRFSNFDWTLKVDPDAVILPWRVREHMLPHVGKKVYVVNCNKFPDSPNFPMMYGSLEIFSGPAMATYAAKSGNCGKELPWDKWGEDYFMTKCMDYIGVGRISDFGIIGDDVCTGADCSDKFIGAFHPFKDVGSWHQCWETATMAESS